MNRIITLTTDFGLKDHYAGAMKGVILGINPGAVITDITHGIEKFNIIEAAFKLRSFYSYFPKGTVHVVVVDPGVGGPRKPIAVEAHGYYFVGPDNGVFSLIPALKDECKAVEITNRSYMLEAVSSTFHGRDIFAPAAAHLGLGVGIDELGEGVSSPEALDIPEPEVRSGEIQGVVIYEDSFGNLVTNIPAEMIKADSIVYVDQVRIEGIVSSYGEAGKGELLAITGSSELLEISVNQGSASKMIGTNRPVIRVLS
ncbi:MAG: SAM-dependent chlorinase/fluorinase [Deltaproteobacteria bacterium]